MSDIYRFGGDHKKAEIELFLRSLLNCEKKLPVLRMPDIFLLYLRSFFSLFSGRYIAYENWRRSQPDRLSSLIVYNDLFMANIDSLIYATFARPIRLLPTRSLFKGSGSGSTLKDVTVSQQG